MSFSHACFCQIARARDEINGRHETASSEDTLQPATVDARPDDTWIGCETTPQTFTEFRVLNLAAEF